MYDHIKSKPVRELAQRIHEMATMSPVTSSEIQQALAEVQKVTAAQYPDYQAS